MYILTINGKEDQGAYSVKNDEGEHILYLFEQEDDATRYALQLEDQEYPEMHVIEVDDGVMIKTCQVHGYNFTVITPNDIVIPPVNQHDFI